VDNLDLCNKALAFLKANLDDLNSEDEEGDTPFATEEQIDQATHWLAQMAGMDAALIKLQVGLLKQTGVLAQFVLDINATGGVFKDKKGHYRPLGDTDWIDLGSTYMKACDVLKVDPIFAEDPDATLDLER
jgi:hypothetical protein